MGVRRSGRSGSGSSEERAPRAARRSNDQLGHNERTANATRFRRSRCASERAGVLRTCAERKAMPTCDTCTYNTCTCASDMPDVTWRKARAWDRRGGAAPGARLDEETRHERHTRRRRNPDRRDSTPKFTIACRAWPRPPPARAPRPRGSRACRRRCRTTSSAGRASFGSAPSPARAVAPTRRCMSRRSRRSCLHGPGIESATLTPECCLVSIRAARGLSPWAQRAAPG